MGSLPLLAAGCELEAVFEVEVVESLASLNDKDGKDGAVLVVGDVAGGGAALVSASSCCTLVSGDWIAALTPS